MSDLNDVVGGANLYGGSSYSFTYDRFCSPNSAIYFNNGYLQMPPSVYFSGNFTFIAWIYLKSYQTYSRIAEFDDQTSTYLVAFYFHDSTSQLTFQISTFAFVGTTTLSLFNWYHVAFVLQGTTGLIYVNGIQIANSTLAVPSIVQMSNNFIGKSSVPSDQNPIAVYDEIQIYQGAMTAAQVLNSFTTSSSNGSIFKLHIFFQNYCFYFGFICRKHIKYMLTK